MTFPPKYAPLDTTRTKQPTKTDHNSCSCLTLSQYIVNGRRRGDSYGRFTYRSSLGSSTVDYFITDLNPESLRAFTVSPQTHLTDHSEITAYLNRAILNHEGSKAKELHNIMKCYRWKESSAKLKSQISCLGFLQP